MKIIDIHKNNSKILFDYWNDIGKGIPFFFETTYESFMDSMFSDKFNDIEILKVNFIKAVIEGDKVIGFIQYGIPRFHYSETGKLLKDPNIGVIRNIYFNKEIKDVGNKLVDTALKFFKNNDIENLYAFYHAMGMSCNGNHGKLHADFSFIGQLLYDKAFLVEHENVYFSLKMNEKKLKHQCSSKMEIYEQVDNKQRFELTDGEEILGSAEIKYLNNFTGIDNEDKVYLVWIGINEEVKKGMGIGTNFIEQIMNYCLSKGYRYMHTDTALNNIRAQKFYERNGFINMGITRSYLKK